MDSLIAAAARALAAGDALAALKRVSLRDDPPALALRGIAMAQLGELPRARELLRRAARGFGAHEELSRARCVVAEAEVALAMRDLGGSPRTLAAAAATLEARADRTNALHARLIAVRRLLLLGRLDEAAATLGQLDTRGSSPTLIAVAELAAAEVALRSLRTAAARAALARAEEAAERARVPALQAEVAEAGAALDRPAARQIRAGDEQPLRLDAVEALLASGALVVDACRRGLRAGGTWLPLARRPVLFALARALAEAWLGDVDRNTLIESAFRTRHPDETHRARLRVEI
ncbi:MAG TPA: helix-turn-helix domain-containing protein, partial [Burkholderiaceae bacterium]|nr:helix-turn-helix domain-containing protein [Burkholderiaceae bacterium]